jgi:hypothetical protein
MRSNLADSFVKILDYDRSKKLTGKANKYHRGND